MSLRSASWAGVATLILAVGLLTGGAGSAEGQVPITLNVTDVTSFVPADGIFIVEIQISPAGLGQMAGNDYELAVGVFSPIPDIDHLNGPLTSPKSRMNPVRLSDLPPRNDGRYQLEIPIRSGDQFDELDRIQLSEPGIYPVSIELRSSGGLWASTRVNLIRLPSDNADGADPDLTASPEAEVAIVLAVSPAEGLTAAEAAPLLARYPDLPITVLLQQGVIGQLEADGELRRAFAAAVAGRPVVAEPNLRLDPSALAAIGFPLLYSQTLTDTTVAISDLGLNPGSDVALVPVDLTVSGATMIDGLGVDTILRTDNTSSRPNGILTVAGQPEVELSVLWVDSTTADLLGGSESGPTRANRLLTYLTLKAETNEWPVVLGGPITDRALTDVYDPFFASLSQPGAPRPILVSEADLSRFPVRPAERPSQDLEPIADDLRRVMDEIGLYKSFRVSGGPTAAYFRRRTLASLTIDRNPDDRDRALRAVSRELSQQLDVVSLPSGQPLTMAAQRAAIPMVIANNAQGPREVLLRFRSDRLTVEQSDKLVVVQPGVSSIDLDVEARSLGVTTVEASVWTPDGTRELTSRSFTVRSTAIPGLSLGITLSAFGLLGLWWLVDSRRSKRGPLAPSRPLGGPRDLVSSSSR